VAKLPPCILVAALLALGAVDRSLNPVVAKYMLLQTARHRFSIGYANLIACGEILRATQYGLPRNTVKL